MKFNTPAPAYQPLYRQIKELITQSLVSGEWGPGEPIPSELELASRYSVSQGTVRKAIGDLAEAKMLVRQQGRGTFVASHSEERSKFPFFRIAPDHASVESLSARLLDCRRERLDPISAQQLRRPADSQGFLLRRVLEISGIPVVCEEIRLPMGSFRGLSSSVIDRYHCMLYSMYEGAFGIRILHVEEKLKAVAASAKEASLLAMTVGKPLLQLNRVSFTYDDKPIEVRRSYCNTLDHHYRNRII
jgi:GntR family transcriptional regulator